MEIHPFPSVSQLFQTILRVWLTKDLALSYCQKGNFYLPNMSTIFRPPVVAIAMAAALSSVVVPSEAKAFVVTLPDTSKWKISLVSFEAPVLFNPNNAVVASQIQSTPWWSNQQLALTFSTAVYNQGGNTDLGFTGATGPRFAYSNAFFGTTYLSVLTRTNNGQFVSPAATTIFNTNAQYALASEFAPIPGPLPVLGAFAAFGWSRRVRKSIKSAKLATAS